MALGDRYLEWRTGGPRGRRRVTLAVAVLVHATAITVALGWGLFHLEEMPTPTLIVWPKWRPAGGGGGVKIEKFKPQPAHRAQKRELVQPSRVVTQPPPPVEGPPGSAAGPSESPGEGPGEGPGQGPGQGPGPEAGDPLQHQLLPPTVAEAYKIAGEKPSYPQSARAAGIAGLVVAKICVDESGAVSGVNIVRGLPMLNEQVIQTVRSWRYRPFLYNGRPMPFCHVANFVFNLQQ